MSDFGHGFGASRWTAYAVALTNNSNTSPTYNAYTQLASSTPFDACGFYLSITTSGGAGVSNIAVDIAIGGSGSEQVIINSVLASRNASDNTAGAMAWFPLRIPAGVRLSARYVSTTANDCSVYLILGAPTFGFPQGYGRCVTYGASGASGTGYAAGTSWTQLAAAADFDARHVVVSQTNVSYAVPAVCSTDLAIGSAGSEQIVISSLILGVGTLQSRGFGLHSVPLYIPGGSRIAIRTSGSGMQSAIHLFG